MIKKQKQNRIKRKNKTKQCNEADKNMHIAFVPPDFIPLGLMKTKCVQQERTEYNQKVINSLHTGFRVDVKDIKIFPRKN